MASTTTRRRSSAGGRRGALERLSTERVAFEVAGADGYPGSAYDLVCFFDCLHDMGDPVGALRHARSTLSPDGVVMLVEPRPATAWRTTSIRSAGCSTAPRR